MTVFSVIIHVMSVHLQMVLVAVHVRSHIPLTSMMIVSYVNILVLYVLLMIPLSARLVNNLTLYILMLMEIVLFVMILFVQFVPKMMYHFVMSV